MPKSSTRDLYFQGKAKWAKLITPDTKFGSAWKITLYPTDESYQQIIELKEPRGNTQGILNVIHKDEDGYNITFKRDTSKVYNGKIKTFNPPIVYETDGKTELRHAMVGNGSDVTVKCQYYTYNKPGGSKEARGSALRLESVRVDKLIPYEMKRDFDEDQLRQVRGLDEQPPQPGF